MVFESMKGPRGSFCKMKRDAVKGIALSLSVQLTAVTSKTAYQETKYKKLTSIGYVLVIGICREVKARKWGELTIGLFIG